MMFGDPANALAIRTFCWFPPLRDVIRSDQAPALIFSRSTSGSKLLTMVLRSIHPKAPHLER